MPFEKLTTVTSSSRQAGLPASVSLSKSRSNRPVFRLAFSEEFTRQHGMESGERYDLLIGQGDDEGVIRLVFNPQGPLIAVATGRGGKKGLQFYCGFIATFGEEAQAKQFCAAERIDENGEDWIVEITLPSWAVQP